MEILNWTLFLIHISLALAASGHALLNKNDPRSVWGWVSFCIVFPLLGSVIYFLFGVNRVRTRAKKMGILPSFRLYEGFGRLPAGIRATIHCSGVPDRWRKISNISDAVTRLPLVDGNRIEILHNGEEAYPPMLAAIDGAERSLYLVTYIFETNETGMRFVDALDRAQNRGVDVRVLLDGVGELYSFPRAGTLLKRRGVRTVRFIPPTLHPPELHVNLRNHRKILIADRAVGFTGGMNIGGRHLADTLRDPSRVLDTHFRLEGPVLAQMEKAFLDDWAFATGEYAEPAAEVCEMSGGAICRTIVDGPNEDPEKLTFIIAGAISSAEKSVLIMTPYFLPSRGNSRCNADCGLARRGGQRGIADEEQSSIFAVGRQQLPMENHAVGSEDPFPAPSFRPFENSGHRRLLFPDRFRQFRSAKPPIEFRTQSGDIRQTHGGSSELSYSEGHRVLHGAYIREPRQPKFRGEISRCVRLAFFPVFVIIASRVPSDPVFRESARAFFAL